MKNTLIKILKIALPIGIGLYLTWFFYVNLTEQEKENIPKTFANANYFWVILSLVIAWLSHFSRAYRWKFQLEQLGYQAKVKNMYHSVMIGYILNLTIPRSGEVGRAGFFARKENLPFDKVFGSIIAERIIDVLMLLIVFGVTTIYVGSDVINDLMKPKFEEKVLFTDEMVSSLQLVDNEDYTGKVLVVNQTINNTIPAGAVIKEVTNQKLENFTQFANQELEVKGYPPVQSKATLYITIGALGFVGLLIFLFVEKVRGFITAKAKGLFEGVKGVFYMKNRIPFLLHTIFIWVCYIGMFWVCSLGSTGMEVMDLKMVLVCFVVGGVAMSATPGGIGLYPLLVTGALVYFGVNRAEASGFSILMWVSQTVFLVVFGIYSLAAINVKFSATEVENKKEMP